MSFSNRNNFDFNHPLVKLVVSFLEEQEEQDNDVPEEEIDPQPTLAQFKKGTQPENEETDKIVINPDPVKDQV